SPAPSPEPNCPPPQPPPNPPPSPKPRPPAPRPRPLTFRIDRARRVLIQFATTVKPNSITTNWINSTKDTCQFNRILCGTYPTDGQRAVAGLDLNQGRLSGKTCDNIPLTGLLDKLEELTFFHVNSNSFSDKIPTQILNFPYFYELDLSNNKFVGEFPEVVIKATNLVFLDLRFNNLEGPVPSDLFKKDLDVIFINNNKFTGSLPANFGSTPARYLTFARNQLTGEIPRSIGDASKTLTEVLFLGNKFEGCLPFEIGYLKKATVFDVSLNSLTGPIPASFGCLEKIQFLNLAHNKFYGTVPESVCVLPGIKNNGNLSLSDNYFTAIDPACWYLLKSKILDVSNNCIPGLPNQRSKKDCYDFQCKVKPCSNHQSLSYVPCKTRWGAKQDTAPVSQEMATEPVTYKSLKPHHRLRM
ncbi:putative serine/threonine kinase plant-type protein, partial [Trifolium medium]|nr:putative serine/threonine kinase plant-type protein [Trifolium medium]